MCTHNRTGMFTYNLASIYVRVYIRILMYIHTCVHTYTHVHTHMRTYVHMYRCTPAYIHLYLQAREIYTCADIYMHTLCSKGPLLVLPKQPLKYFVSSKGIFTLGLSTEPLLYSDHVVK